MKLIYNVTENQISVHTQLSFTLHILHLVWSLHLNRWPKIESMFYFQKDWKYIERTLNNHDKFVPTAPAYSARNNLK